MGYSGKNCLWESFSGVRLCSLSNSAELLSPRKHIILTGGHTNAAAAMPGALARSLL